MTHNSRRSLTSIIAACTLFTFIKVVAADEPETLSLEDILDLKTTVASKQAVTTRESPGVVSLITQDQIRRSGARDLMDVLRLVPGFQFGADVQGLTGPAIRGMWGHEGKILLMVDGFEMNDLLAGTIPLNHRFSADMIDRVEIIRGPGSPVYGGSAGLAVINLITKAAAHSSGAFISAGYGRMKNGPAATDLNLGFGKKFSAGSFSATAVLSRAHQSDRSYTDSYGNSYSLVDQSKLNAYDLAASLKLGEFTGHLFLEKYGVSERDAFDQSVSDFVETAFISQNVSGEYRWRLASNLSLTPKLAYRRQLPYRTIDPPALEAPGLAFDASLRRIEESLSLSWDPSQELNAQIGLHLYQEFDRSFDVLDTNEGIGPEGAVTARYSNHALFTQLSWNSPDIAHFTIGSRVENHSTYGFSFVPRFAVTKTIGNFHAKLLINSAFRSPVAQNIQLQPDIKPERTMAYELEFGFKPTKFWMNSINFFQTSIKKPIIYTVLDDGSESYFNGDRVGTRGLEFTSTYRNGPISSTATYSFYTSTGQNYTPEVEVPEHPELLAGLAKHKATWEGSVDFTSQLNGGTSVEFLSERYGKDYNLESGEMEFRRFPSSLFWNLHARYSFDTLKGLSATAGLYNILNRDQDFIQPYNGDHSPLPGASREWRIRFSYVLAEI